jgi:hypothetical protein
MAPFKVFSAVLAVAQLAGCAQSPGFLARQAQIEASTPVCVGEQDCRAKWRAARHWLQNDTGFPIRLTTDEVIETYSGLPAQDPRLIARVIKKPVGDGHYEIRITAWCLYDFGCIPDRMNAALAFNKAIGAVLP